MKKGIIKLILAVLVIFLLVRLCTSTFGNVITLPGGMGGSDSDGSGGWFSPKEKTNDNSTVNDVTLDIKDLERELGIGTEKNQSPTINIPSSNTTTSTTTSSSTPLSFKGIPMTGSLSAFGQELVKAGFRSNGNGTYTGDFAGYSGCKITPSGNPVQDVRIDFPVISDWNSLEKAYDGLQASLTQKYGMEPKTSTGSNVAVYDLPNGTITLDADVANQSTWHVILKYSNNASITLNTNSGRNPIDDL
jgi:hypothetical protein